MGTNKNCSFLVTLMIALALLIMPFGVLPVSAAESTDVQVTATTSTSVKQGDSGYCYVYIDSLEGLSSLMVAVHYDPNKVSIAEGSVFNVAPNLLYAKGVRDDNVQFSYIFDGNGNAEKTQLFYFEYTILSAAESGEAYFDIVVSEAYDSALHAKSVVGSRCAFSILPDPNTVSHSYTRQVIEDAYKKSDATCTSPAVYYYCCETCTKAGTTTYEHGDELGHTGGTATCTAKAICTRCAQPYGNMLDHVYTDEDATATYLKEAATCTSKAVYYKNCASCDKAGTATFEHGDKKEHSYKNDSDADCNVCGQVRTTSHAHNHDTIKHDEENHWSECACGDKVDVEAHAWDDGTVIKEATYEEDGEKTFICSICSREKVESIDKLLCEDEMTVEAEVETEDETTVEAEVETEDKTEADVTVTGDANNNTIDGVANSEPTFQDSGTSLFILFSGVIIIMLVAVVSIVRVKRNTRR